MGRSLCGDSRPPAGLRSGLGPPTPAPPRPCRAGRPAAPRHAGAARDSGKETQVLCPRCTQPGLVGPRGGESREEVRSRWFARGRGVLRDCKSERALRREAGAARPTAGLPERGGEGGAFPPAAPLLALAGGRAPTAATPRPSSPPGAAGRLGAGRSSAGGSVSQDLAGSPPEGAPASLRPRRDAETRDSPERGRPAASVSGRGAPQPRCCPEAAGMDRGRKPTSWWTLGTARLGKLLASYWVRNGDEEVGRQGELGAETSSEREVSTILFLSRLCRILFCIPN